MKIKENITVYQCDHCKKHYVRKHMCEKHENLCTKNPENIPACWGCANLIKEGFEIEGEYYSSKAKTFKCKKTDSTMCPITSSKKDSYINYSFVADIVMPKKCDYFIGGWEAE